MPITMNPMPIFVNNAKYKMCLLQIYIDNIEFASILIMMHFQSVRKKTNQKLKRIHGIGIHYLNT